MNTRRTTHVTVLRALLAIAPRLFNEHLISATPFLWLQHPVDDAAYFYAELFDGEVLAEEYSRDSRLATIRVAGQTIHLFNAGPRKELTDAFSLQVSCSTQEDLDRIWAGLLRGGTPTAAGWIDDRFGVTWQIVPVHLNEWLRDPQRGPHVSEIMQRMVKLDFAPLQAALRGD